MNSSREIPQALIESAHIELQRFLNTVTGIDFVMLCSSDGFELALASKKNIDNTGKIAAVSSSILAMVSACVVIFFFSFSFEIWQWCIFATSKLGFSATLLLFNV